MVGFDEPAPGAGRVESDSLKGINAAALNWRGLSRPSASQWAMQCGSLPVQNLGSIHPTHWSAAKPHTIREQSASQPRAVFSVWSHHICAIPASDNQEGRSPFTNAAKRVHCQGETLDQIFAKTATTRIWLHRHFLPKVRPNKFWLNAFRPQLNNACRHLICLNSAQRFVVVSKSGGTVCGKDKLAGEFSGALSRTVMQTTLAIA